MTEISLSMESIIDDLNHMKLENYSISGIIQFLRNQSMKNEIIRAQWNVEKAELQARIAFLQGERKGQENLKTDLVKRIKMLEFALHQENHKLSLLKSQNLLKPEDTEDKSGGNSMIDFESQEEGSCHGHQEKSSFNLRDIRQFLVDNGYRDMMSEIRESRVKQLLGLSTNSSMNSMDMFDKDGFMCQDKSVSVLNQVERNFPTQIDISPDLNFKSDNYKCENFDNKSTENNDDSPIYDTVDDSSTFDDKFIPISNNSVIKHHDYPKSVEHLTHPEILESESSSVLGELASLTIVNEAVDPESNIESIDATAHKHNNRISWTPKFSLRSHFDSIRCLSFHETKPLLITGSEDRCLKLWNLIKTYHSKKSSSNFEVEPIYTFKGHGAPVLSLAINDNTVYSGDLSGEIKVWNIPSRVELYDEYDPSVLSNVTLRHSNAVWSMCHQKSTMTLVSGSADGIVHLWNTASISDKPLRKYTLSNCALSSMSFFPTMEDSFVVGTGNGEVLLVNSETGQTICSFPSEEDVSTVYKLIIHPSRSLIISGHEDRKIRMFDIVSGKLVSSLVAHLDAVTSLAIENKSGLHHLLSSSHDCSIRLWDLSTQACIQETTSHRKKFDESINDISVHPSLHYFASGGADAIAKVFV